MFVNQLAHWSIFAYSVWTITKPCAVVLAFTYPSVLTTSAMTMSTFIGYPATAVVSVALMSVFIF